MASQLAFFLHELPNIPLDILGADLSIHESRQAWTEPYAEFQHHLFRQMHLTHIRL